MKRSIHGNGRAILFLLCIACDGNVFARQLSDTRMADRQLAEYFQSETAKLQDQCLSDIKIA